MSTDIVGDLREAQAALSRVRALVDEYHEAAQGVVNTDQAALARRAVYLRARNDIRAALGDA